MQQSTVAAPGSWLTQAPRPDPRPDGNIFTSLPVRFAETDVVSGQQEQVSLATWPQFSDPPLLVPVAPPRPKGGGVQGAPL